MKDTSSHYLRGTVVWHRHDQPAVAPPQPGVPRVAYIMNVFPNLTETFVYRELESVRAGGVEVLPFAIRRAPEGEVSRDARHLFRETHYILPLEIGATLVSHLTAMVAKPRRYLKLLMQTLCGDHHRWRDRGRSLCHFVEAIALLPALRASGVQHVHAHFAVGSATCAWIAARYLDLPFSFTAHAYDIWLDRLLLTQKLRDADFVVTCTDENRQHLRQTYPKHNSIRVVHHGVDVDRFVPTFRPQRAVPQILSVGRLCEQKGFDVLLQACAILKRAGEPFECHIVGEGGLRQSLEQLTAELGLTEHVRFLGRAFQEDLPAIYGDADIFALACKRASDNDRDGIPNTVMEAMASGLPVVSTRFSGVPELVDDGTTGYLAPPEDPELLARCLRRLLRDPECRREFGAAGRARVLKDFSLERAAAALSDYFRATIAAAQTHQTNRTALQHGEGSQPIVQGAPT